MNRFIRQLKKIQYIIVAYIIQELQGTSSLSGYWLLASPLLELLCIHISTLR